MSNNNKKQPVFSSMEEVKGSIGTRIGAVVGSSAVYHGLNAANANLNIPEKGKFWANVGLGVGGMLAQFMAAPNETGRIVGSIGTATHLSAESQVASYATRNKPDVAAKFGFRPYGGIEGAPGRTVTQYSGSAADTDWMAEAAAASEISMIDWDDVEPVQGANDGATSFVDIETD